MNKRISGWEMFVRFGIVVTTIAACIAIYAFVSPYLPNIRITPPNPNVQASNSQPSVTVSATNANGTPMGINVVQGQQLTFHASGYWCSRGIKQDGSASCGGPEGIRPAGPGETDLVLPNQLVGLLIGRIGTWVFPIGSSTQITAQASGQLYLLMNDRTCCYADNSGQVTASIAISGAPGADIFLLAPFNTGT